MGSVFSKKKEPKPEKPKITKQDEEVLVSKSGFHCVGDNTLLSIIMIIKTTLFKEGKTQQ